MVSDTSNYEDTFDFIEIDGYYAISLTTASGTFYIGENPGQDPFALVHTVMMPRITSLCMVPDCCLWEIFETASGEYSFRNVESQYFLYSTGDVLRTTKLDVILGNPAMYPCFWNILNAASIELNMPVNLNQKFKETSDNYTDIYNQRIDDFNQNGCMACSYANIVAYYNNFTTYSVREIIENQEWWNWNPKGYFCAYAPNKSKYKVIFSTVICNSEIEYLLKIKQNIDLGRPVMLHFGDLSSTNNITESHYVVAYKYINDCAPTPDAPMSNVYVLDPYNSDTASEIGSIRTAYEARCILPYGPVDQILLSAPYTS